MRRGEPNIVAPDPWPSRSEASPIRFFQRPAVEAEMRARRIQGSAPQQAHDAHLAALDALDALAVLHLLETNGTIR